MKLGFLSDIHLDSLDKKDLFSFRAKLRNSGLDAIVISGDIGESQSTNKYISFLDKGLDCPLYYVLGNHDFFNSSIDYTRTKCKEFSKRFRHCKYIHESFVELTPDSCLIGYDGWCDGLAGSFLKSRFEMPEFFLVQDFKGLSRQELFAKVNKLGEDYANHVTKSITELAGKYKNIYYLTHVPPLQQSALFQGEPSPDYSVGCFCSVLAGNAFLEVSKTIDNNITVLCGHTHSANNVKLGNLEIKVSKAARSSFKFQEEFWETIEVL